MDAARSRRSTSTFGFRVHRSWRAAAVFVVALGVTVPITAIAVPSASASSDAASPGDIQTVAGNGTAGSSGDGAVATAGEIDAPYGSVVDALGNVYLADSANNRIQEIPAATGTQWGISMTAGDVYTIAGSSTGSHGTSGDGGAATSALLDDPTAVALDSSGNLYIADAGNNRIQELASTTHSQWGISMTADDIYTVAGSSSGSSGHSGDSGVATSALLSNPTGVALSASNNLFVADAGNNRIQEVSAVTGTQWGISMTANDIYTVAGSSTGSSGSSGDGGAATSALLHAPAGLTVDPSGDLYVADSGNNRVQEVAIATGEQWGISMTAKDIYTVLGSSSGSSGTSGDGGAATGALLSDPVSVALDPSGDLYVADSGNNRVQEVVAVTGSQWGEAVTSNDVYTVTGSATGKSGYSGDGGRASGAFLSDPTGVSLDTTGDVFVSDSGNERLREITPAAAAQSAGVTGDVETVLGSPTSGTSGDSGQAIDGQLATPWGDAVDAAGNVYVADKANNRVQEIAATAHSQWGISMSAGDVYTIAGSSTGSSGDSGDGGAATSALLSAPTGVALDSAGDLYIADSANNRIQFVAAVGCSSSCPWGLASTIAGDVYTIAGSSTGSHGTSGDGGAATSALLHTPTSVALDAKGNLYVADSGNNRIQEVASASGTQRGVSMTANDVYTIAGSSTGGAGSAGDTYAATTALLDVPYGVALDGSGNLYIADYDNNRVQEVPAASGSQWGISMTANHMYTAAGSSSGSSGTSGDGGASTSAKLDHPYNVALDANGDLYVADGGNNRVQEAAVASGSQWGQSMTAGDIYTVAGSSSGSSGDSGDGAAATSALFATTSGVAVAPSGELYVVDQTNDQLRAVLVSADLPYQVASGDIETIAGNGLSGSSGDSGQATESELANPNGVAVDDDGNVYVADEGNNRVQEIAGSTHTQWGISMTAGNTYTILGSATGVAGSSGDGGAGTSARLDEPMRVVLDPGGDLFVADDGNNRVQELAATTHTQWGISMTSGDVYTIAGSSSGTSGDSGDGGAATSALLYGPKALAFDSIGDLLISDSGNNRVQFLARIGCSSSCAWGLSSTSANDIYTIAGSATGSSGDSGDAGAATSARLDDPQGLVVDPEGNLYIADMLNNQIRFVAATTCSSACGWGLSSTTANDIYTIAGNSSGTYGSTGDGGAASSALLNAPYDVTMDPGGNLYVADTGNHRIQEIAGETGKQWGVSMTTGDVYTIAGTGTSGFSGDGGAASAAELGFPTNVVLDAAGDLYVVDENNEDVREILSPGALIGVPSGPNQPNETTGGSNPSEAFGTEPSTSSGDVAGTGASVSVETGELDVSADDDSIPGRGISLELDRSYSSADAGEILSPFGYGWTDSYNMQIGADPTAPSTEDVYQEDGSVVSFTSNGNGAWVAPSRVQATLTESGGNWTFTRDATTIYTFNSSGELTSIADLNGNTTNLSYTTYEGAPVLNTVTDPSNRTLTFSYTAVDGYAFVSSVTDGTRTVSYTYYPTGDLDTVTDVGGGVTTYTYDAENRIISIEDPLTATTNYTYNNANQVTQESDQLNRTTTWSYGEDTTETGTTTVTDPMHYQTAYTFQDGELSSETEGVGTASAATTSYGYYANTAGVKTVTDPDGHITTYVYDQNGNLLRETNPLGDATSYAYNTLNEQVAETNPLGGVTLSTYDSDGNLLTTSVLQPDGSLATTTDVYGDASNPGLVTESTDPLGKSTYSTYDSHGDLASTTDPSGNETTYTYNSIGEKTEMVSPRGNVVGGTPADFTTTYSYDAYGNLTETSDPLGHTTKATYDDVGDKLTSTDQNGNVTTYAYDADKELTSSYLQGGNCGATPDLCTSYVYNADGQKTQMTDANGQTTTYSYDPLGRLTSTVNPLTHTSSETYDAAGNELTSTDQDGNVTKYVYNAANELTSETPGYGTAAAITESYTYDADGNKTSYADGANNTTTYAYNFLNQETSVTDPLSNETSYTYDQDGRLSTTTNPDGKVETDTYYANGELDEESYSDGVTPSVTYTYNPDGKVATMVDGSGTSTYSYDDADRLSSYENGAGVTVSYGYDDAGNATSITYPGASHTVTNTYNALEELSSVKDWNAEETQFSYDADGDLTGITYPNGVTDTTTYDDADQLASITDADGSTLASFTYTRDDDGLITAEADTGVPSGPSSFSYNSLKELTGASASTYTYNAAEDLTTAPNGDTQGFNADDEACFQGSGSGTCGSPPAAATTYTYSNEGNRTATTPSSGTSFAYDYDESNELTGVTPSSGAATTYSYDGNGLLQSETTSSVTTNYTWNVEGSLPLLLADGTNYYLYGPSDTPIEQINESTGATSYLLSDQLGSVRAITNSSGAVTGTETYDAWGNSLGTTGTINTPFGYAGEYLDPSNGLYYLQARWFDASTGQFMSLDPKVATTLQPYQYVGNDPVNGSDPSGEAVAACSGGTKLLKGQTRAEACAAAEKAAAKVAKEDEAGNVTPPPGSNPIGSIVSWIGNELNPVTAVESTPATVHAIATPIAKAASAIGGNSYFQCVTGATSSTAATLGDTVDFADYAELATKGAIDADPAAAAAVTVIALIGCYGPDHV